jgi:hypothetical protein
MDDLKDVEVAKDLGVEIVPEIEAPQVEPKVRAKRTRGVLKSIKQLMEGKELSVEDICKALESSGVKRDSVQSMLSNYTRKGLFKKTDVGYKLSEVEGKPCP